MAQPVEVLRVEHRVEERVVTVTDHSSPRTAREWRQQLDRLTWALESSRFDLDDLDDIAAPLHRAHAALEERKDRLHRRRQ